MVFHLATELLTVLLKHPSLHALCAKPLADIVAVNKVLRPCLYI